MAPLWSASVPTFSVLANIDNQSDCATIEASVSGANLSLILSEGYRRFDCLCVSGKRWLSDNCCRLLPFSEIERKTEVEAGVGFAVRIEEVLRGLGVIERQMVCSDE